MDQLTICTFNLRYDNPADGNHSWSNRKSAIKNVMSEIQADLVGTQEGKEEQLNDFQTLIPNIPMIMGHREWIKERMYPSLFFSFKKLSVIDSGDIWLSLTPDIPGSTSFNSIYPRVCTWAKFSLKTNFRPIFMANLHLDHVNSETRIKQTEVFISEINKIFYEKFPMIIVGDFNEGPNDLVYNLLMNAFPNLYDPWIEGRKVEMSSHHHFDGNISNGKRIDWILLDKRFKCDSIEAITKSYSEIYPSDHFPIYCKVSLLK